MAFALDTSPPPIRALVASRAGRPRADGVRLYAATDLTERHAAFEVARCLPRHVLIGDDSGGQGVLVALAGPAYPSFSAIWAPWPRQSACRLRRRCRNGWRREARFCHSVFV